MKDYCQPNDGFNAYIGKEFSMKVIYIASPYLIGDMGENVAAQIAAAHLILDLGHCPIAPLLSHFLHIYRNRLHEEWLRMDLELVCRSDILLRLPGGSQGADKEVEEAKANQIPVCFGWRELFEELERRKK